MENTLNKIKQYLTDANVVGSWNIIKQVHINETAEETDYYVACKGKEVYLFDDDGNIQDYTDNLIKTAFGNKSKEAEEE